MKKTKTLTLTILLIICLLFSACDNATPPASSDPGGTQTDSEPPVTEAPDVETTEPTSPPEAVGDFEIFEASILELSQAMESGELTAVELTEYYLERIRIYDPLINSIITINPAALEDAAELDAERAEDNIRGPLHGIPILLKDNFDTTDMPTTSGSAALEKLMAVKDAFTVTKLREAGAIILGKANMTEFARHGMGVGSMIGQTLNPYDLTRTPGGSSAGTGAAIAANFAVAGTGSDTVNSIRSPSSANSLVGIRPTIGLVSRSGISPCSHTQDVGGPIARTVSDAAILLGVMAGYDESDTAMELIKGMEIPDYTQHLKKDGLEGKRIGLLRTNFGDDPDVLAVMEQAIIDIKALGAEVIEIDEPLLSSDKLIAENDVQLYEQKLDMNAYFESQGTGSPIKNLTEYLASGKMHPSIVEWLEKAEAQEDPANDPEYLARLERNEETKAVATKIMEENDLDAFMYPLQQILVVRTDDARGQAGRNGIVASVMGWTAITLPGGFSTPDSTAPLGVPIGIEFMGPPLSEPTLIEIGYAYEQATMHRQAPKSVPDVVFP